jgi:hypothetical protein
LAGNGTGDHAVAAGADGGEVGVAAVAPGVDLVDADAVAAQYFAVGDELALDGAALVDVQRAPGDVVDQAAVVAGLGVVADGCQVAVGVVAAFVPDGVFGRVVALPDPLPQQAAVVVKAVDPGFAEGVALVLPGFICL